MNDIPAHIQAGISPLARHTALLNSKDFQAVSATTELIYQGRQEGDGIFA